MKVTLNIDSATDDEMRRALLAWHFTHDFYPAPKLALDGLVVRVCGSGWYIDSPPIPASRAEQIVVAMMGDDLLDTLEIWRDLNRKTKEAA